MKQTTGQGHSTEALVICQQNKWASVFVAGGRKPDAPIGTISLQCVSVCMSVCPNIITTWKFGVFYPSSVFVGHYLENSSRILRADNGAPYNMGWVPLTTARRVRI